MVTTIASSPQWQNLEKKSCFLFWSTFRHFASSQRPPWNDRRMNTEVLFFPDTSDCRTGVWPHYGSICECHQSRVSYLCLFQVPPLEKKLNKKKLWQTHPASAVSQDLGPIRYTAPYTLTNTQRQIIYDDVKTCPSVWGSADKLCERAPMENKQRSFSSLNPPHPSLKTPLETVSGPHAYEEELWTSSSGEGDST